MGLKHENALFRWVTHPCTPNLIYMRCKKVQRSQTFKQNSLFEFYCIFSDLRSLALAGVGVGVGVSGGGSHMPLHSHTCMLVHNTKIYMYRNCKWPSPWRHPSSLCLTCMCVCVCVYMHVCMDGWVDG